MDAPPKRDREQQMLGKKLGGIVFLFAVEKAVAKGLAKAKLRLPSSLVTMLLWLGGLKSLEALKGEGAASVVVGSLKPAVDFLGKWMTLFLTPPLVMLPVAIKTHASGTTASQWRRLVAIHGVGWALSCVISAAVAYALRQGGEKKKDSEFHASTRGAAAFSGSIRSMRGEEKESAPASSSPAPPTSPPPKKNDRAALDKWFKATLAAYALHRVVGPQPAAMGTTVSAIMAAKEFLPPSVSKVAHPIVVAAATTAASLVVTAAARGETAEARFRAYMGGGSGMGSGDLLAKLMNASVSCLGIRMFLAWRTIEKNFKPLAGAATTAALFSLIATPWVAGKAKLPESLGLVLSQRSVMSALGMDGAKMLGASDSLAVASILLTGVYGASLGGKLLELLGLPGPDAKPEAPSEPPTLARREPSAYDPVTRGTAMGASAHAIGTASLLTPEPDAAAISSVSLCFTGIVHIAVLSLPSTQKLIKRLAQG